MMNDKPLTTTEAGQLLGIKTRTVTQHILRGNIKAVKWGRDYMIEPSEVERFRQHHRGPGRPPGTPPKPD